MESTEYTEGGRQSNRGERQLTVVWVHTTHRESIDQRQTDTDRERENTYAVVNGESLDIIQ